MAKEWKTNEWYPFMYPVKQGIVKSRQVIEGRRDKDKEFLQYVRKNDKGMWEISGAGIDYLQTHIKPRGEAVKTPQIIVNNNFNSVPAPAVEPANEVKSEKTEPSASGEAAKAESNLPVLDNGLLSQIANSLSGSYDDLKSQLSAKDQQIQEKDRQIAELQQTLKAQLVLIGRKDLALDVKDKTIAAYKTTLDEERNMSAFDVIFHRKRKSKELDQLMIAKLNEIAANADGVFADRELVQCLYGSKVEAEINEIKSIEQSVSKAEPEEVKEDVEDTETSAPKAETTALNEKVCVS